MEKEYGNANQEIATNMKENINKIKKKEKEYLHGKMVAYIKEIMWAIWEMDMAKCFMQMVEFIKANG